ncbi:patatin-like phospholipase family protein [bacterium]|nr:patatin-like phospholipase family protein [bacterium]
MTDNTDEQNKRGLLEWTRDAVNSHMFLLIAFALAVVFLALTPQIRNLYMPGGSFSTIKLQFIFLVGLLAYLYLSTALLFIFPGLKTGYRLYKPAAVINGWLYTIAHAMVGRSAGAQGYVFPALMFVVGITGLFFFPIEFDKPYILAGSVFRIISCWICFVALWLFVGKILGPAEVLHGDTMDNRILTKLRSEAFEKGDVRTAWQAGGEVLAWMAAMGTILESLWASACFEVTGASFRLFSICAAFHIAATWLVIAALLDFVQKTTVLPARFLAVCTLVVLFVVSVGSEVDDPNVIAPLTSTAKGLEEIPNQWLSTLERRIDKMQEGPVVLVSASGGGSRAALFTALVLQMLTEKKMQQFPEARKMKIADDYDQGTWGDHILMISSVSGGSLAVGRYLKHNAPSITERISDLRYSTRKELIDEAHEELRWWSKPDNTSPSSAVKNDTAVIQQETDRFEKLADKVSNWTVNAPDRKFEDAILHTAFASRFADDMAMDFMAPILRGFMTPGATRGEGLYHFWNSTFGWADSRQSSFAFIEDGKADGEGAATDNSDQNSEDAGRPLVLMNTTDADAGRRVIVGFPPLPSRSFLSGSIQSENSTARMVNDKSEYMPVCLQDFPTKDTLDLSLTRAVRLSSNFPFGFSVPELSVDSNPRLEIDENAPTIRGVARRDVLRLIDGGVVDNTGIDSLHAVFEALQQNAGRDPLGHAARVLDKIRKRGVVILEIDSGAKPTADAASSVMAAVAQPLGALNNAIYTNALRTGNKLMVELHEILSDSVEARVTALANKNNDRSEEKDVYQLGSLKLTASRKQLVTAVPAVLNPPSSDDHPLSVIHFRFVCNHLNETSSDVMTALALGPQDKAIVTALFLSESMRWNSELKLILENYKSVIGKRGLNSFKKEDVPVIVSRLLQRARTEVLLAEDKLAEYREELGHVPESAEEHANLTRILARPYALLTAVRLLADPRSTAFKSKSNQMQNLAGIVSDILSEDGLGQIATAALEPVRVATSTSIRNPLAPTTGPKDAANPKIYDKLTAAVNEARSVQTKQSSKSQLDDDLRAKQMRLKEFSRQRQLQQRTRSKYLEGMRTRGSKK